MLHEAFKASIILIGGFFLSIALLADWIGSGQPGTFGFGQFLLTLFGTALILSGWLGKRILNLYRITALTLFNTLLLFAFLELVAIAITRSGIVPSHRQTVQTRYKDIHYYASQDWTEKYFQEALAAEHYQYRPYILWRHRPFQGELVNVNSEGLRVTPGAQCGPGAYKVFTFGGSTMWGWGAPDWATIAAFLQAGLDAQTEAPVCVLNLGEDGYVSTQSLVVLIIQLQSGNYPDLVIFYDGVNDIYAAYESGQAGNPATLAAITAKVEEREHPLVKWIKSSRLYSLAEGLATKRKMDYPGSPLPSNDIHRLADSVTSVYLANYEIVSALALQYRFDYHFFWQPHLAIDGKPLTTDEQAILARIDPTLNTLSDLVYADISLRTPDHEHLSDLADVFRNEEEQLWTDEWGHITPAGNWIVANAMLKSISIVTENVTEK